MFSHNVFSQCFPAPPRDVPLSLCALPMCRYYFWGNAKRFADLLMLLETSVCGPGAQGTSLGSTAGDLTSGTATTA